MIFLYKKMIDAFSRSAALFESFYIFCWLDWDGDNILASNAECIRLRFDKTIGILCIKITDTMTPTDGRLISANKEKTRLIVQSFHQLVDFIKSGKKQKISKYSKSYATKRFDSMFDYYRKHFLLKQIGIKSAHIPEPLSKH